MNLNDLNCTLFKGIPESELLDLLSKYNIINQLYQKGEYVFNAGDIPKHMYVLLSGTVTVEKTDMSGKRIIVNSFSKRGTVFGEVYLYLSHKDYDYSCLAMEDSEILMLPRNFIIDLASENSLKYGIIIENMLEILSEKAYHLNQKLLIHSSFSLRQKIANYILQTAGSNDVLKLVFNREELANYIGTTRPSLSRELMNMEEDGLISVSRDIVNIIDRDALEDII